VVGLAGVLSLSGCSFHTGSHSGSSTASTPAAPAVNAPQADKPAQSSAPTPKPAKAKKPLVVGFGDSVPSGGGGCNCVNFVSAYANIVGKTSGVQPGVDNFAVSGSTSADFLDQLSESKIRDAVADRRERLQRRLLPGQPWRQRQQALPADRGRGGGQRDQRDRQDP
jgi:hypothetical protein